MRVELAYIPYMSGAIIWWSTDACLMLLENYVPWTSQPWSWDGSLKGSVYSLKVIQDCRNLVMFTKCACHVCVVCLQLDARYKLLNPSAPRGWRGWNPRASPVRYGFNSSNTSRAHIRYVGDIRVYFLCFSNFYPLCYTRDLCCISKSTMKHQQKFVWKLNLLWFSYGYGKYMFIWFLVCIHKSSRFCSLLCVHSS